MLPIFFYDVIRLFLIQNRIMQLSLAIKLLFSYISFNISYNLSPMKTKDHNLSPYLWLYYSENFLVTHLRKIMKILIVIDDYFNQSNGMCISTQRFAHEYRKMGGRKSAFFLPAKTLTILCLN